MTSLADRITVYVVNLRRRPDRRARIGRQLPNDLPVTFTSDWDGPFDGQELSRAGLAAAGVALWPWQIDAENEWWNRPLKYGEIGCALSHLSIWRAAAIAPVPYTVILEDDAVLAPTFVEDLSLLVDALDDLPEHGLVYLGRSPLEPDTPSGLAPIRLPGGRRVQLVVPGYSHCTFGYLVTATGLDALLAAGLGSAVVPVDEFLPALYHPHPRPDLRKRFPVGLRALACEPPLVRQLPKNEAGSDTEDSDFVESNITNLDQPSAR